MVYKTLEGDAPDYMKEIITKYVPRRPNMRSESKMLLKKPTTFPRLQYYGHRSLFHAAPDIWNNIDSDVRLSTSVDTFKKNLKTHLFKIAYHDY